MCDIFLSQTPGALFIIYNNFHRPYRCIDQPLITFSSGDVYCQSNFTELFTQKVYIFLCGIYCGELFAGISLDSFLYNAGKKMQAGIELMISYLL